MKKTFLLATLLAGVLVSGHTQADEKGDKAEKGKRGADWHNVPPEKRAEHLISELDKDGNGTISKEEFRAAKFLERMKERRGEQAADQLFDRVDANSDGEISKEEWVSHAKARAERAGERKGPRGPRDKEGKGPRGERDKEGKAPAKDNPDKPVKPEAAKPQDDGNS